jgi:hypothetical protein
MAMRAALIIGLAICTVLASTSCLRQTTFSCTADTECGAHGVCEIVGFCAFDDPTCTEGHRFGELSGAYANQCVGPLTDASVIDADLSCSCAGDHLTCRTGNIACALGCENLGSGGARCLTIVPSNGVDPTLTDEVTTSVAFTGAVLISTDTGEITGTLSRDPGQGVLDGIGYYRSATLGVFVFHQFDVGAAGVVHFTGTRAAVFLVGTDATISGTIDGSGGCYGTTPTCAGPGGGIGASGATPATGCGPGGRGANDATSTDDGGGGGGGGGLIGGSGGIGTPAPGGTAGAACIAPTLEPLIGGSGGGAGGPGASTTPSTGGGGGGALQISALGSILVTGTITMGGAGGTGGPTTGSDSAGGGGGGAGGAILLEAISVSVPAMGTLAVNGGGGGGGGRTPTAGNPGANGHPNAMPAAGGAGLATGTGAGADGGARNVAAKTGPMYTGNAGGGGGGVGVIHLRARTSPTVTGTTSPAETSATVPIK